MQTKGWKECGLVIDYWLYIQDDYKKTIATFGPRTIIPFTETEWNFRTKYCEACAQEWYGKQQCHPNSYGYSEKISKISNSNTEFFVLECDFYCEKP